MSQPQLNLSTTSTELGLTGKLVCTPTATTQTIPPSKAATDQLIMLNKQQNKHQGQQKQQKMSIKTKTTTTSPTTTKQNNIKTIGL